jgi:dihydroorotase
MKHITRRHFLGAGLAAAGGYSLSQWGASALAQGLKPGEKFDLVIKGGDVVDPSQSLRGVRDIGIRNAVVMAMAQDIPSNLATAVIDASGKIVTPGLIDLHAHVYPLGSAIGLPADELAPITATTTFVSAGDAGANNFGALKHYIIGQVRSRVYAFVHISSIGLAGFPVLEMKDIDYANVDAAAKCVAENADVVLGIKVRQSANVVGNNGLEPLKRAIIAAERAGTKARVMVHIGGVPGNIADLLDMLRPGDVLTHAFSGSGNNTVQDGKVVPAALAAKKRGVIIDVGHGGGSFDYTVCEPAIQQGFGPDVISSDIHASSGNSRGKPFMPWVMSKFLNMGYTLEQVVAMSTINPAKVIDRLPKLGTLQIGAPGDVSIFDLIEGPVSFVDTRNNTREGKRHLKPVHTIRAGRVFGGPPYFLPSTYP